MNYPNVFRFRRTRKPTWPLWDGHPVLGALIADKRADKKFRFSKIPERVVEKFWDAMWYAKKNQGIVILWAVVVIVALVFADGFQYALDHSRVLNKP